ncbi:MAG: lysophospholipid acyltransferase family protein [Victivallales bacterium]|nr:lysophospholipid acyltransferase family protein [Victivallales bacterium]
MSSGKSKITDALIGAIVPVLLFLCGGLSDKGARCLAGFVAALMRLFYRPGVKLIRTNLALAFPDASEEEIRGLSNSNLTHVAWNWIDFLRILRKPSLVESLMEEVEGADGIANQIILCLPHLGSWELLAQYIPKLKPDSAAVAEVFPYKSLNRVLDRSRSVNGLKLIPRTGAAKNVVSAIRKGTSIGFLIDQNLSPRHGGIFVDFRGLPVPSSPLPAIIALRYGVRLVSGTCVRKENGKFKMLLAPVPVSPDDDKYTLTQKILAANESLITKYPEQYIWLYQRWKYIPSDIPDELKAKYPYYAKEKGYMTRPDSQER